MKSRLLLFALLVGVLAAIPVAASAIPAPPFETNTSCLECHDVAAGGPVISTVDFSAASVDLTKCNSCHWVQNHYPHGSFVQCNSCHYTMPSRTDFFFSNVSTPSGFFASALSPTLDPALIHEAHTNGSWPVGVTTNPVNGQAVYCASCHAPAACDACHGTVAHGNHTASAAGDPYPGVSRTVARGATPAQYSTTNTTVTQTSRCINPSCHDVAGVPGAIVRRYFEENSPIAVYTPAWSTELATSHSGGQAFYTDRAGRKVDITITGPGIARVYGVRNIRGGLAEVSVDGGPATRIDYFSNATQYNSLMFQTDDLSPGTHTITITALGLRSPGSIGNRVYLDVARVLNLTGTSFEPDCTDCHPGNTVTHGYDSVDHVADVGPLSSPGEPACGTCHEMDVLTEHEKVSSSSAGGSCGTCHPAPRDTYGAWDQSCEQGGCHATGSATAKHSAMADDHAPAAAGAVCADCHPGDLGAVHVDATVTDGAGTRTTCNVCHTSAVVPTTNDCTVCHFTFDGHYDSVVHTSSWTLATCDSAGCHPTRDLMGAHTDKNPDFTCFGCHSSSDPIVVAAIDEGDTACGTCHTSVSQTDSHRSVHWANPPLVGGVTPTPFYSYYTGTSGTSPTTDCAGCHVSNLVDEHMGVFENGQWTRVPRTDSAGATLTCATCHASLDAATMTAIALGQTKCDACHVVHGPIGKVHTSTYVSDPAIDCAGCHSADLTVVHNGSMTTTTPSGKVLSGCEMCHAYTEGELGQRVQDAISVTNDTKCDACHLAYHEGSTSHAASSPASVDGCGECHGTVDEGSVDVVSIHAAVTSPGPCKVCHNNPTRVGDLSTKTAECASCHATSGADYHRNMGVHISPEAALCSNQCHHRSPDVTVVHTAGCTTCHTTVNTEGITTACTNCHPVQGVDYHTNIDAAHMTSDAASADCTRCHEETSDVRVIHETSQCATCHTGMCSDCHTPHFSAPGTALLKTMACSTCHQVLGTDYHLSQTTKHEFGGMDPGCLGAECHAANTLPEAHEPYLARYPQYTDTCALCHLNDDSGRIDWATASADCSTCHTVHGDIATIHTATLSEECVRCHSDGDGDVRAIHVGSSAGACAVCHMNPDPGRVGSISGKTAECVNCHNAEGADYHRSMSQLHVGFSGTGCLGAGCHPSADIPTVHARFVGPGKQFSQYADTCELCHLNTDSARINWTTINGGICGQCHGVPHDRMNHRATSAVSVGCVECHESNWVPGVHGADGTSGGDWAKCDTCHNNPLTGDLTWDKTDSDCEQCHDRDPVDTKHYPINDHAASDTGCDQCHYTDLRTEHFKPSAGPVSCVQCHETYVDTFTAPWDKSCEKCHATKHGQQATDHVSTRTDCAGSGCHAVGDVSVVHANLPGGGCAACHTGPASLPTTTDCTSSGCHSVFHSGKTVAHTATTPASSDCGRCHDKDSVAGVNVEPVHADAPEGECWVCHGNPSRVPDVRAKTAECASCHAVAGTEYHRTMNAKHTFGGMDPSCVSVGCHAANTLPEAHAPYMARYPQYTDTCALCHLNADSGRIDWTTASADCSTCHTVHGDIAAIHTAPDSQGCVDCHETADVRTIHGATHAASCTVCHDGRVLPATTKCVNCHEYAPVDTKHYPAAPHLAVTASGCSKCHSLDLRTEHFKPSAGPVSCVQCHETYVDTFTAPWDKSCEKCHPTKHGQQQNRHGSTRTDCAGSGCHAVTDVGAVHSALPDGGCDVCHKSATSPATTTDCGTAGCHPTATPGHHESHNAATFNPTGCKGCHFTYLDDEHIKLGMTCDTCHKSTNTLVKNAIANRDRKCLTCHPTSPHNQRQAYEFAPGNASMHRVSADLPGMRSTFYVNGGTYTWSLPPASSFLKTGYARDSMVSCDSCHTYTGAGGPHGAAMKINIDPAYPTAWTSARLTGSGSGMSSSTIICAKCHTNLASANGVHNEGDHEGYYCNSCHVSVPHGWGRPRLIGYTTDPAPYTARTGGLIAMKLKNYSYSSGWNESDCYAGCDDHGSTVSPVWPNSGAGVPSPTTGTVTGRITDATTGVSLSGAAVSLSSGATGTSGADGTYALSNVAQSTVTMTIAKAGYATATRSVTVKAGQTTTLDVALTANSPNGGNLAFGKTFTASRFESSTYAPNKAGDGDSATYWWSKRDGRRDDTEWLRVDLGTSQSISSAEIEWFGAYFAKEYRLYTSTNGWYWVQAFETSSGTSGTKSITFSSRTARYVRIECRRTGNERDTGYGIGELRVFK